MITDGFTYLAALLLIAGCIKYAEGTVKSRFFEWVPGAVVLYFLVMVASSFGVWEKTPSVNAAYKEVKGNILPAMIFLMLLKCDLNQIISLGPRMLGAFFISIVSLIVGFTVMFLALHTWMPEEAWKAFGALAGSWMGGTGNMVAVQSALDVPDSMMGYALLIDSIDYAVWVVFLLAMVPYSAIFNRWAQADTAALDRLGMKLQASEKPEEQKISVESLSLLIGSAFAISALAQVFGNLLPEFDFFTGTTWTILLATLFGIIGARTPLSRLAGSAELAGIMLFAIIALIASRANFAELTEAPMFVAAGFIVLFIHGGVMVLAAKLFKLDLFSCGIASLANIGGVASAPILAASYNRTLIPIGVLMALLGYIVGTGGGLLVGKILSLIAG